MSMQDLIKLAKNKEGRKVLLELLEATKENSQVMRELTTELKKHRK